MYESAAKYRQIGRILAGGFSGSALGFLAELFFFWDGPPETGIRFPVAGTLIGFILGGVIGIAFGGLPVYGWWQTLAKNVLIGIVIGVMAGIFVYAPVMTALDPLADELFYGKIQTRNQQIGMLICGVAGAFCGLVFTGIRKYMKRAIDQPGNRTSGQQTL